MLKLMIITLVIVLFLSFTHPQVRLAFSVGTGIGISSLQKKINNIQANAIRGNVTAEDKVFLIKFYRTLANGAAITFVLSEASRLMHHYLDGSGKQTSIKVSLFTESPRVEKRLNIIRKYLKKLCVVGSTQVSDRFDMGYIRPLDAAFSLYYGKIEGTLQKNNSQKYIQWTATMPWKWPTNTSIKEKYGTYKKEIFPIPNIFALISLGPPLWLPNALGGELEKYGLAKSFPTKTVWIEKLHCQ